MTAQPTPYPNGLWQEWLANTIFHPLQGGAFWLAIVLTIALFAAGVYLLSKLGPGGRRQLTVSCTFAAGFFYLLAFALTPGTKAAGKAEIGGTQHPFSGEITFAPQDTGQPPPPPPAEDELPPWEGPVPRHRELAGRIELTDQADKPEAKPFIDYLEVSGKQLNGEWQLELTDRDGPKPLAAQDRHFSFTSTLGAGTLDLRYSPALNVVKAYEQPLGNFMIILGGFTIFLGLINLTMVHGRTLLAAVRRRRPVAVPLGVEAESDGGPAHSGPTGAPAASWPNALAFFVGLLGMVLFGIWKLQLPEPEPQAAQPLAYAAYSLFFDGLLRPLQSTTFALLGFFIVSAAYRAFRVRTLEAGLMTAVAFIVMLGQVPLGQMLTAWIPADSGFSWLRIEVITNWLLTTPNTAATRGILFGAAAGGFALSLRVWLSLERGAYFGKEF